LAALGQVTLEIGEGLAGLNGGREVSGFVFHNLVEAGEGESDVVAAGDVAQAHGRAAAPGDDRCIFATG